MKNRKNLESRNESTQHEGKQAGQDHQRTAAHMRRERKLAPPERLAGKKVSKNALLIVEHSNNKIQKKENQSTLELLRNNIYIVNVNTE